MNTPSVDTKDISAHFRALLNRVTETTTDLERTFESTLAPEQLRVARDQALTAIDQRMPRLSLGELLVASEVYVSITAPTALADNNLRAAYRDAERLRNALRQLSAIQQSRAPTGQTTITQGFMLRGLLSAPAVSKHVRQLEDLYAQLAQLADEDTTKSRPVFRLGTRFLVPISVLVSAAALIAFLFGGIAFATGAVNVNVHGIALTNPLATATVVRAPTQAPTTPPAPVGATQPTAAPSSPSTATPQSAPAISVSPSTVTPCYQSPDTRFVITYSSGNGPLNWTATSPDPSNYQLSIDGSTFNGSVSGGLNPGQSVTITVRLVNLSDTSGQFAITASGGAATRYVVYDSSNC